MAKAQGKKREELKKKWFSLQAECRAEIAQDLVTWK